MSYVLHHAIVVTGPAPDIHLAHDKALDIFTGYAKPTRLAPPGAMGGYHSFMIAPDGSNEGWHESHIEDNRRSEFIKYLRSKYHPDGSSPLKWVEVQFGEASVGSAVIASSDFDYEQTLKERKAIVETTSEACRAQKPAETGGFEVAPCDDPGIEIHLESTLRIMVEQPRTSLKITFYAAREGK